MIGVRTRPRRRFSSFDFEDEVDDEDDWSTLRRAAHCGRRFLAGTVAGPTFAIY
jgi:hypothetical protein